MTATDTSPVSVASYFVNMYFVGCLHRGNPERLTPGSPENKKSRTDAALGILYYSKTIIQ